MVDFVIFTCHMVSSNSFWADLLFILWFSLIFPLSEGWFCTLYRGQNSVLDLTTGDCESCWCFLFSEAPLMVMYSEQGSKFHLSDRLRRVNMTVGQVEYLQDLSARRLRISDFHISCIGLIYYRQVNGTFGQVIFTIHLPDGQVHSIWNFKACRGSTESWQDI